MKNPIPPAWLSKCKMQRIVVHWSGGSHQVSDSDREHYHIIIDGAGNLVRGEHDISDNRRGLRFLTGRYAAHALNFNAGSIGLALAGMQGAQENPFKPGSQPINEIQWNLAAASAAQLCDFYNIPVTYQTVLQHGEIEANTGVRQRGKWDCCRLPWEPGLPPNAVCSKFRQAVIYDLLARGRKDLVPKSNGGSR